MRSAILALLFALVASGCVERYLLIETEPVGARVLVDAVDVGRTPARVPFEHYGTREVILRREGDPGAPEYESARHLMELDAPWYQWFPLDFFFDHLLPFTITDERRLYVQMVPIDEKAIRARIEQEAATHGLPASATPPPK